MLQINIKVLAVVFCYKDYIYRMFYKELYNSIPNATVWRVLRKRLHLKAYKLSVVQDERSQNTKVFITTATRPYYTP
jgi:hypothetical protein